MSGMDLSAEKVVAEWRAAMEGVTPGPWLYRPRQHDDWGVVRQEDGSFLFQAKAPYTTDEEMADHRSAKTDPWGAMAKFLARCSPAGISGLLALIESQRATIESLQEQVADETRDFDGGYEAGQFDMQHKLDAAEARVTALEAEMAGAVANEREACARVVDAEADITRGSRPGRSVSFDRVAASIRARQTLSRSSTEVKNDER